MKFSRKQFLSSSLAGLTGAAVLRPTGMAAQLVDTSHDWSRRHFHAVMTQTARYRQVFDVIHINDGGFLNNIKNSLNGFQFGFGLATADAHIVAALHGPANLLNFDDSMWAKYRLGEWQQVLDPRTHQPAIRNVFYPSAADPKNHDPNDERSIYQDRSMQGLQRRGVHFFT